MPILLVLLFVGVPLLEIIVIQQVGAALGWGWTVALLVGDSLIGAWLLRVEGRRAWSQFRVALSEGRWPGDEVAQGALVIVGGTLLLTPGFVTDVVGFLLLFAPTRRGIAAILRSRMVDTLAGGSGGSGGWFGWLGWLGWRAWGQRPARGQRPAWGRGHGSGRRGGRDPPRAAATDGAAWCRWRGRRGRAPLTLPSVRCPNGWSLPFFVRSVVAASRPGSPDRSA